MKAFMLALDSMGLGPLSIGKLPPNPEWVNKYFDDSTGTGDNGETDQRGPWNEGGDWEYVQSPAVEAFKSKGNGTSKRVSDSPATSTAGKRNP
ncbi:MAG TPA: hypothetical protein VJ323_08885, partial [Bryobacteraceae bacterium]|nr:hypothetical protein [Bryobacteraceae bacterium]